jgi:cytochrome c-type biogenesis protein CcmH
MLLGVVLTLITLAVLAVIALPLLRSARPAPERAHYDRAVYRDQMNELERDVARGLIGEREAASARVEIQRRMLASDAAGSAPPPSRAPAPLLALVLCVLIAGASAALYWRLGSPGLPDEPYASRVLPGAEAQVGQHNVHEAATALAARLQTNPNDREGWLLYARTMATLNEWAKSVDAYKRAVALGADGPDVMSGYGEMLVLASQGMVTPAARDAFTAALAKDPKDDVSRYYMALADAQAGEPRRAIDAWLALAGEAQDGSPMRDEVVRRITETAKNNGLPMPTLPPPAPPSEARAGAPPAGAPGTGATEAMANLPPEQRDQAIRGMVQKLAAQLQANPNDADGWVRLGRSYGVLGDADKATDAFDHAARLKPDDASIPLQEARAILEARKPDAPVSPSVVALLHKVEAKQPDDPEVLWYLGVAAAQDDRFAEAKKYWQRLLPLLPADSDDRKMVQQALDTLPAK